MKNSINNELFFKRKSRRIRKKILDISFKAQVGHIGSAFSIVEILTACYFSILNISKKNINSQNRDRFILSKGHAAPALYATLNEKGLLSKSTLFKYCQNNGLLEEHPRHHIKGVEVTTGSLGHGLSIGCGMALAAKLNRRNYKVFVLISDAECNEGTIWEAAMFSAHHQLNNLIVFLDYNKVQALGNVIDVLALEPLEDKWRAFGWNTVICDGHNCLEIIKNYKQTKKSIKPTILICHTIRGKGVSFMQHTIDWHYKNPSREEYEMAMTELT